MNKIQRYGIALVAVLWAALGVWAWLRPQQALSLTERRRLAQRPSLTGQSLLSGEFTADFDRYAQDQFPLRERFRSLKALTARYVLCQRDNHGIYLARGHLAEIEAPLDSASVAHAAGQLAWIYENYLQPAGCSVYAAVVPDKGYYLAQENGYPAMDYEALFAQLRQALPWARHIELTGSLQLSDYYRTDTHWRQEALFPAAQTLAAAMGITPPRQQDFTLRQLQTPFYGVYCGLSALPAAPEKLCHLENERLSRCRVYFPESGRQTGIYTDTASGDLYETFLGGSQALVVIENPTARSDRELLLFRDSFGSAIAPLLVEDYRRVTLIDIRYLSPQRLDKFIDFHGQDVLLLYSSLVLNRNLI